jgi:hypothetical protein
MGGNFICIKGEEAFMGNALVISRPGAIGQLKLDLVEMMHALNDEHEKFTSAENETGYPLWPNLDKNLATNLIFAGSTQHIFDAEKISDEDLIKGMSEISDLDLYIPKRDRRGDTLSRLLEKLSGDGTQLGAFSVICYKKHDLKKNPSVPGETLAVDSGTNAIFQYHNPNGDDAYIQIDFMPTLIPVGDEDPETQKKMELWVKLSHSSDWDDRKEGVKGVFHKYLLQAMFTALTRRAGKLLTAGSLKATVKPKKIGYEIKVKPPKVSAETEREMRMSSFSVDKAVARKRLVAIKDVIDKIIAGLPGDLPGDIKDQVRREIETAISQDPELSGVDLYKKTVDVSSDADEDPREFVTDVHEIFSMLFGFTPDDENLKKLYSFRGLLSLIGDHILASENGEQKCREIFKDFVNRLFGPIAQEIDTQSGMKDAEKKNAAIERIKKVPELKNLLPNDNEIDMLRRAYYTGPEESEPEESEPKESESEESEPKESESEESKKDYYKAFNIRMGPRQQTKQRTKASLEESSLRLFVRGIINA